MGHRKLKGFVLWSWRGAQGSGALVPITDAVGEQVELALRAALVVVQPVVDALREREGRGGVKGLRGSAVGARLVLALEVWSVGHAHPFRDSALSESRACPGGSFVGHAHPVRDSAFSEGRERERYSRRHT